MRADATDVQTVCAYVTRETDELLVFEGPDHAGLQVPTGTVEADETPREAVFRELGAESGLGAIVTRASQEQGCFDVGTIRALPRVCRQDGGDILA